MIKRVGPNKYVVYDRTGKKKLSKPTTLKGARKRLQQVEAYANKEGAY